MRYKCRTFMEKLTEIQRFRFSEKTTQKLNQLAKHGINKSDFVRKAVEEKLKTVKFVEPKEYCPF